MWEITISVVCAGCSKDVAREFQRGGGGGRGETCSSNLFLLLPLVIRWIVFLLLFLGVASVFRRNHFTVKHKLLNCGVFALTVMLNSLGRVLI